MRHVTREEMQEIDRRAIENHGIPAETLMENAGKAVADEAAALTGGKICIVCGKGNNGGDGRVAARLLRDKGFEVSIVPDDDVIEGDLVIDALFGTGLSREVEGRAREWIEAMNRHGNVLAIDVPSGLDANTGRPLGVAVRARVTVTMGLPKVGFLQPGADAYTGRVVVADIGFPAGLL